MYKQIHWADMMASLTAVSGGFEAGCVNPENADLILFPIVTQDLDEFGSEMAGPEHEPSNGIEQDPHGSTSASGSGSRRSPHLVSHWRSTEPTGFQHYVSPQRMAHFAQVAPKMARTGISENMAMDTPSDFLQAALVEHAHSSSQIYGEDFAGFQELDEHSLSSPATLDFFEYNCDFGDLTDLDVISSPVFVQSPPPSLSPSGSMMFGAGNSLLTITESPMNEGFEMINSPGLSSVDVRSFESTIDLSERDSEDPHADPEIGSPTSRRKKAKAKKAKKKAEKKIDYDPDDEDCDGSGIFDDQKAERFTGDYKHHYLQEKLFVEGEEVYTCYYDQCTAESKTFKVRCHYIKHLDSHFCPYRCPDDCTIQDASGVTTPLRFSSTACAYRHRREKHKLDTRLYYCPFSDCAEASYRPKKRTYNWKDHIVRKHNWDPSGVFPDRRTGAPASPTTPNLPKRVDPRLAALLKAMTPQIEKATHSANVNDKIDIAYLENLIDLHPGFGTDVGDTHKIRITLNLSRVDEMDLIGNYWEELGRDILS